MLNLTLFHDFGPDLTFGVESDIATELSGDSRVLLMPQLQYDVGDHFEIQGGLGVEFLPDESDLIAAFRFIWER